MYCDILVWIPNESYMYLWWMCDAVVWWPNVVVHKMCILSSFWQYISACRTPTQLCSDCLIVLFLIRLDARSDIYHLNSTNGLLNLPIFPLQTACIPCKGSCYLGLNLFLLCETSFLCKCARATALTFTFLVIRKQMMIECLMCIHLPPLHSHCS